MRCVSLPLSINYVDGQRHGSMPRAAKVGALAFECAGGFRSKGNCRRLALLNLGPDAEIVNSQAMTHVLGLDDELNRLSLFHGNFVGLKGEAVSLDNNRLGGLTRLGIMIRSCRHLPREC